MKAILFTVLLILPWSLPQTGFAQEKPCGCWIDVKTGKQVPGSDLVPHGARLVPLDPNHAVLPGHAPTEHYPNGVPSTTFVRVPCPPPETAPPSHASVRTPGQPIVEINPPTPVPLFELGIGYNYIRASDEDVKDLHGVNANVFYNVNSWFSLGGEFMADWGCDSFDEFNERVHVSLDRYAYFFGPRVSLRPSSCFRLFAQVMVGGDHDDSETHFHNGNVRSHFSSSADAWAFDFGVGADWQFTRQWSWRIIEASYLATTFSSGNGDHWQDNWRISTGLVFRFGGPPPPSASMNTTYSKDATRDY